MVDLGRQRYRNRLQQDIAKKRRTNYAPERLLASKGATELARAISAWRRRAKTKGTRDADTALLLGTLAPKVVAALTTTVVLDSIGFSRKYTATAMSLGAAIEDELLMRQLRKVDKSEVDAIKRKCMRHGPEQVRRTTIKALVSKLNITRWSYADRASVGACLIEIMIEVTGWVFVDTVRDARGWRQRYLRPTKEILEWLEQAHDKAELMSPFYMPTKERPLEWTGLYGGGYRTSEIRKKPLVKLDNRSDYKKLDKANLTRVFDSVNALQATQWKVNTAVLKVVQHFWEKGVPIGDMVPREDLPIPRRPADYKENREAQFAWRRKAAMLHQRNNQFRSHRLQVARMLFMADELGDSTFYYPYQLDFRGRFYCVPYFLQPQGMGLARGLLAFARGEPVAPGSEAEMWFKIHGANCFGVDKVSFTERLEWVEKHSRSIIQCAEDPISFTMWSEADKPWEFLAWCFEYRSWLRSPQSFLSHLPIQIDGSNNGLQIYSLLLRDRRTAEATNTIGGKTNAKPKDIYQDVADDLTANLKAADDSISQKWLKLVGGAMPRAAVKRAVMTLPYGATRFACRRYVHEWWDEQVKNGKFKYGTIDPWYDTKYLSTALWDSIERVVQAPRKAMAWLRKVSSLMGDKPLVWTTPNGFVVSQAYARTRPNDLIIYTSGKRMRLQLQIPTTELSPRSQANGFAPNFVHSLDAAVLSEVVLRGAEAGIQDWFAVHDSFGTHASNVGKMHRIIREVYADIFSEDLLMKLRDELQLRAPEGVELPLPPHVGDFGTEEVLDAPYIFA